jgi:hypothetical protein
MRPAVLSDALSAMLPFVPMPSAPHEILIDLFRERPESALELLRTALGDEFPAGPAVVVEASFTQIVPTEYMADLVLVFGEPAQLGVVVEVQLRRDEQKRFTWPLYAAALRDRKKCPTAVLVVAPDAGIAAWSAKPIIMGPGGSTFHSLVVGPTSIPIVTTPEAASAAPELSVLSGLAHAEGPHGEAVLRAMVAGLDVLRDDLSALYSDFVLSRLSDGMRQVLEDAMNKGGYEFQSDYARKYVAQGKAEGQADEARRLVLRQLARQVGLLGPDLQARVEALEVERLEALGEALLGFKILADLQAWLESVA